MRLISIEADRTKENESPQKPCHPSTLPLGAERNSTAFTKPVAFVWGRAKTVHSRCELCVAKPIHCLLLVVGVTDSLASMNS